MPFNGSRILMLTGALIASLGFLCAQEPGAPAQPAPEPQAGTAESSSKQPPKKATHTDDFLIRGTVFTPDGLALPGADLRIRRASEKKFKWNDATNSRGEFAVRVKMGADYEVVVRAKGYQEQSQAVNAATGERFKDLVFRMKNQTGRKS
jgi:hypothetical protein